MGQYRQKEDASSHVDASLRADAFNQLLAERDAIWAEQQKVIKAETAMEMKTELARVHKILSTFVQRTSAGPPSPVLSRDPRAVGHWNPCWSDEILQEKVASVIQPELDSMNARIANAEQLADEARGKINIIKASSLPALGQRCDRLNERCTSLQAVCDRLDNKSIHFSQEVQQIAENGRMVRDLERDLKQQATLMDRVGLLEKNLSIGDNSRKITDAKVSFFFLCLKISC